MTNCERNALLLSCLSVYKRLLDDSVINALYMLLKAQSKGTEDFVAAWSSFFSELCKKGCADNLSGYVTKAVLYDENPFTIAAAGAKTDELPNAVEKAALNDLTVLKNIGRITPQDILSEYLYKDELSPVAESLPLWECGRADGALYQQGELLENIKGFHKSSGCGIFARYRAFIWRDGDICPVHHPDVITLDDLKGYEYQRNLVLNNTGAFLKGLSANNCLLYGDKGTGKSSTVKAILNEHYKDGLRIVEMPKERLCDFPLLVDKIAPVPMKFIIYIDDLSFQKQDDRYASLKAVLEGGLAARPKNTLIYATSNRRHLVKESFSDRDGDDLHRNDTIQESLSLADRFGLSVNFAAPDKQRYLSIVKALAQQRGIEKEENELYMLAERWALERGGRSPRCARQFIDSMFTEK